MINRFVYHVVIALQLAVLHPCLGGTEDLSDQLPPGKALADLGLGARPFGPSNREVRLVELGSLPADGNAAYCQQMAWQGDRLYFAIKKGQILEFELDGTPSAEPFLDVASLRGASFIDQNNNFNFGIRGFAFHPDYANNQLVYTMHRESNIGSANLYVTVAADSEFILAEWDMSGSTPTMREVFRIGFESGNAHRAQNIGFNPVAVPGDADYGNIYCSFGDNTMNGIIDLRNNGQDFSNVAGSVIRIHPEDPSGLSDVDLAALGMKRSANGKYSLPLDNPWIGQSGFAEELYAKGFRNPVTMGFSPDGSPMVGDVGELAMEEINLVRSGGNYGWSLREGTFAFTMSDQTTHAILDANDSLTWVPFGDADDPSYTILFRDKDGSNPRAETPTRSGANDDGLVYPVAQYSHEGNNTAGSVPNTGNAAIIAGQYYDGIRADELDGLYIFGDLATDALYYIETTDIVNDNRPAEVFRLPLVDGAGNSTTLASVLGNSRADMRFGRDRNGDVYLVSKTSFKFYRFQGTQTTTVTPTAVEGSTSDWDQNWNFATVASGGSGNLLPAAIASDKAVINSNRVVEVTTTIDVGAGAILVNDTSGTGDTGALNILAGGMLDAELVTIGAGDDSGFLNITGGELAADGVTVTANNPLNAVTVSGGLLDTDSSPITLAGGNFSVTGGSVTTSTGLDLSGGDFNLSSGTVMITDPEPDGALFVATAPGGSGALNVSGGNFVISGPSAAGNVYGYKGEINISGGTFGTTLGQMRGDPSLVMNILGDEATVNIARFNTNNAAWATTVNFIFDETGVSKINSAGFTHLVNATINIDGSAYKGGPATFELFDTQNIASTSSSVNITGLGIENTDFTFSQSTGSNNFTLTILTDRGEIARVWDGDTSGDWSVATNWVGNVAPVENDVLAFAGTMNLMTNNDFVSGPRFSSLQFTNTAVGTDFTLRGSPFNLAGDITSTAVAVPASENITDIIALDFKLDGDDRSINLGEGHDLGITGIISEDEVARGLIKEGDGLLRLSGANTYSGDTTINDGVLEPTDSSALGSSSGKTTINAGATLLLNGGLTIADVVEMDGDGASRNYGAIRSTGNSEIIGELVAIGSANARIETLGFDTLTLSGGVSSTNSPIQLVGDFVIENLPVSAGSNQVRFATDSGGLLGRKQRINVGGNVWGSTLIYFDADVVLGLDDALPTTTDVLFGWSIERGSTARLDLNGFNQAVSSIAHSTNSLGLGGDLEITGGGTLTINLSSGSKEFQGRITDGATPTALVKNGAGTQIVKNLSGIPSNYSGGTLVNEGILSFGDGASNSSFPPGSSVSVASGAELNLNFTGNATIGTLFLAGEQVDAGTYSQSHPSGLLTGSGALMVTTGPSDTPLRILDVELDAGGNVILTLNRSSAGLAVQQSNDLSSESFGNVASIPGINTLTIDSADVDPDGDGSDFYRVLD
ncbi:PQQ-dependent sugar dehydrogenase [Haloferula sp.]|uniref:PQQ-dependent sugar dehydrogenase n=1 Tax=Haloferula sp. TaxID=2497595 RepID=UPI003C739EE9